MNREIEEGAVIEFPDIKSVEVKAAEWLVKLDGENLSESEHLAFKRWIKEDDKHRACFEELIAFNDDINVLTQAVLPREQGGQAKTTQSWTQRFWPRHWGRSGGAFALTALLCGVWLFSAWLGPSQDIYTTQIGEQRTIELQDGSSVILNTDSRLIVRYNKQRRYLELARGEAHFEVFHNPERPFEVYAAKGLVRAVGTAFSVHIRKLDVEVIVSDGTVELDNPDNIPLDTAPSLREGSQDPSTQHFEVGLKVKAGTMLTYDRDTLDKVELMVVREIEEKLSWHKGLLVFENQSLASVVEDVSRYTSLKILIPERDTRKLKVSGLFKAGDTEALFEALQDGFGIHVQPVSEGVVYLISSKNLQP